MASVSNVPLSSVIKLAGSDIPLTSKVVYSLLVRKTLPWLVKHNFLRDNRAQPDLVSIKITDMCNLRCRPCAQWGERGYNLGCSAKDLRAKELPVEQYNKLIDDVVKSGTRPLWYIWGGEPFMYVDLMKVTGAIRQAKMHGAIVTNGFKVKECAAELVQQGWDLMYMSQDGTHEIHRQNRPGANEKFDSYDMLRNGTVELVEQRRKQNKKFPVVLTLNCITSINQHDLLNTVLDAQAMGVDAMVLYPAWFTTLEDGLKHEAEFERRFGTKPYMWKGYVADCHDVDVPALQDELRRIKADPRVKIPWTLMPDIPLEKLDPYYHDHTDFLGYNQCFYPWTYIEIQPNGDVSTCRDYGDYICGNITQNTIYEIFNNERYQKFRKSLREDGMMPICSRCCGLMGF